MTKGWRPPPKAPNEPRPDVDEDVLRYLLKVNPDMRRGRSTEQVIEAMSGAAAEPSAPAAPRAAPATDPFEDMVATFLGHKAGELKEAAAELARRRRALDDEERALRERVAAQMVEFLRAVERGELSATTRRALRKHAELLRSLGLDEAALEKRLR